MKAKKETANKENIESKKGFFAKLDSMLASKAEKKGCCCCCEDDEDDSCCKN